MPVFNYRIGVDLGGTKTQVVLMHGPLDANPLENIVYRKELPTKKERGYQHILNQTVTLIKTAKKHLSNNSSISIGVGMPGDVDEYSGMIKNSNTECLNGMPFRKDLCDAVGTPITFANDANCFTLAEALWGAGAYSRFVFGVILGTGVGGGIVIDRKIHLGRHGIAGEWGHMCLIPNGRHCYCSRSGCVETYLSGPALIKDLQESGFSSKIEDLNQHFITMSDLPNNLLSPIKNISSILALPWQMLLIY